MGSSKPDNVFRASVGVVVINGGGEVLALERADVKGAWQMPQGGLKKGEEPLDAAHRELREETGIEADTVDLVGEYPEWLAYELPPEQRSGKYGRGQVQKWYLFRYKGDDGEIDLENAEAHEFVDWRWTSLRALAEETASFRREIYRKLAERFGLG